MQHAAPLSRRAVLRTGAVSLVGAVSLAGCLGQSHGSLTPQAPTQALHSNGWQGPQHVERRVSKDVSVAGVTKTVHAHAKGLLFTRPHSLPSVASNAGLTSDALPFPTEAFVAGKVGTNPNLSSLLTLDGHLLGTLYSEIVAQARPQLERAGFRDFHRVQRKSISVTGGHTATYRRYQANYPYSEQTLTRDGTQFTIHGGSLPVELQSAIWVADGLIVGTIGVHPNAAGEITVTVAGRTRTVDLGFTPERDRRRLEQYTTQVS